MRNGEIKNWQVITTCQFLFTLHIEGFHAQNGVTYLAQELQQLLGILGADGLVCDHVGEVLHTVHLQNGSIQTLTHLILQHLGHPDDTAGAAFSSDELLGGDEVLAVAHEAGGLNAAAGHGGHLGEAHAQRSHAGMLTAGDDNTHGQGLNTADTLEAAAGGHGILEQGVQSDLFNSTLRVLVDGSVHGVVAAQLLVLAAFLQDGLARTGGIQLLGSLGIQPGHGTTQTQTLGGNDTDVAGGEGLAHDAGVELVDGLVGHGSKSCVTGIEDLVCVSTQFLVLYDEIERNSLFCSTVADEDRSFMNVDFVMALGYEALEEQFAVFAAERGAVAIKGHRSVGGFRASCYNAMPLEGVRLLAACMKDFEKKIKG